ncbi:MAG: tetratricopeptide repeat protein [Candidatus Melainabacteria bacterium]|nr:tetratricopeptide repeat protein [Candidatus Melainabacteria bacterium]
MQTKKVLLGYSLSLLLAAGSWNMAAYADSTQWSNLISEGEAAYKARALDQAESKFSEALKMCDAINFPDAKVLEESRGITLNDLALVLDSRDTKESDDKAIKMYREAIEAKQRAGASNASILPVMNNLAKLQYKQKNYKDSIETFQAALKLAEGEEKLDQLNRSRLLNALSAVYTDSNELERAEQSLREVLAIQEKIGEPKSVQIARNNLSVVLRKKGNDTEAQKLLETNTKDGNETPSSLTNLARVLREQQKFEEADPLLRKAVKLVEASPEPHDKELIVALNNLAMVQREQANFDEALAIYKKVEPLQAKIGASDTEKLSMETNFGVVLDTIGNYDEARPHLEKALALCEKVDGVASKNYATCLYNLKELFLHMDDYANAEIYMKKVLEIHKAQNGANDAEVGRDLNELALIYRQGGKISESEPTFKDAIAISEKGGDATAGDLSVDLNNLARLYRQQGRYADAEPLYKKSLSIKERLYGADDSQVAATLRNYANLLEDMGRANEAKEMNSRARKIEEKAGE